MADHLPQIPLWIRIETGHDSRLVDVSELKSELQEQNIPVQLSSPWHPSCSTGLEFVFELFANIKLEDIIISGIVFDGFKFTAKKIWNYLRSFVEKNKQADFYPLIIIHLDDVTIKIDGYKYRSIKDQTIILEKIANHIRYLSKQGIDHIVRIDIPCPPTYLPENVLAKDYEKVWRVRYGAGDYVFYNPTSKQLY